MSETGNEIAIIGMAGRFPGAQDIQAFWRNLREGIESISFFREEELEPSPLIPEGLRRHPGFVRAGGVLEGGDLFDHGFFELSPREAQWMDPQQRVFLECAWTALEDAGLVPERFPGKISLYAGAGQSAHLLSVLGQARHDPATLFEALGASGENVATRTSYKLRLRGESMALYTACSTGLVAIHMACQSLLMRQSDVALAGAVRVSLPQRTGYLHQEGMIFSPDGHCRAFDAHAAGTVTGNGVGVVVLKPLANALRDRDHVYAVIKGSAINNDGNLKAGYTAPSIEGQAEVIAEALAFAGVEAEQIGYVEAHGTGTRIGDPIEVTALSRAFRQATEAKGFCALGSVKTNIGHLDTVAGVAGLIKAALALYHEELPATLHFEQPNPGIDFANSPFFVNGEPRLWGRGARPRRAGVSSFGIGGTNAHAILEEAPAAASRPSSRPSQLITLSARTPGALEVMTRELAAFVEAHPEVDVADLAFSRNAGRRGFECRRYAVAEDAASLLKGLRSPPAAREVPGLEAARGTRLAFLFPGQGAQSVNMGRALYAAEPAFREALDTCLAQLAPRLGRELRPWLHPPSGQEDAAREALANPRYALPALFSVEYALAQLWRSWGFEPHALLGHSFGEYVAACLSGVLSLEDALTLVVARGRLMERMPPGRMISAGGSEAEVRPLLTGGLSLAAVNGAERCVVSGPVAEVEQLERELARRNIGVLRLPVGQAFHSAAVEPLTAELEATVRTLKLSAPRIPYVSSLTGTWIRPEEATDPRYWARQMREPVRFAEGLDTLLREDCRLFLEVGPDQALTSLTRAHLRQEQQGVAVPSLPRHGTPALEHATLMGALGALWQTGLEVPWERIYAHEQRHRVPLPAYPFERKRFRQEPQWLMADAAPAPAEPAHLPPEPVAPPSGSAELPGPRSEIERGVMAIWRERLGRSDFGIHDNFLELGGNSLMAAQMLTRLREAFPVHLPLKELFEAPTVASIAERIGGRLAEGSSSALAAPSVSLLRGEEPSPTSALVQPLHRAAVEVPRPRAAEVEQAGAPRRRIDFSLSYFANDEDTLGRRKYQLLLEGARFADAHGFSAVWTPERHFHSFGGLYPSPAITGAGVATITEHLQIRAGSVVLPLHDPILVAEQWAAIDNLSNGRVGVSFASGWNANDFVFAPERYARRKELMLESIELVRHLWRGGSVQRRNGAGELVEVAIRPRPVQPELPFWLTAAGSPETFRLAGQLGANVLTNLMGQSLESLREKVALYREAWRRHGHGPGRGHVSLMLHTFLGADEERVRRTVREPLLRYFRGSLDIMSGFIASQGLQVDVKSLTPGDIDALLEHGLERYIESGGLFGTPESCMAMVDRVRALDIDEIACLIDFGVESDTALAGLPHLAALRARSQPHPVPEAPAVSLQAAASPPGPPPITPVPREGTLPVSFSQQRFWYLDQLEPGNAAYNDVAALRLAGRLDVKALERALGELVRRHEALRTTFGATGDGPVQSISPSGDFPVTHATLEPSAGREGEIAQWMRREAQRPFDLRRGPLVRAALLRAGETEHILLFTLHHIITDGWSAGVLMRELAAFYAGFVSGTPATLPPLSLQYADYAVWQRRWMQGEVLEAELAWWKQALADVPVLRLATDRPRPAVQSYRGARHFLTLPRLLADALGELVRRENATLFMGLMALWQLLLHRYSGQVDFAVGTPSAGRNRPESEALVGCFVNSLALRANLAGDPTFQELLGRVRRTALEAFARQEAPFEKLVDALQVKRDMSHTPVFQTMLVLHNTPMPSMELAGLSLRGMEVDSGTAKFDVMLELRETAEGLRGSIEYNVDLFDAATIGRMAAHLHHLLRTVTEAPGRRLSLLPLLPEAELRDMLETWTATALPFQDGACIHQLFEQQAERTPDAVALVRGGESLRYAELGRRANQLAHRLRRMGVGPEVLVGACLERSIDAVVAFLAILKAGGAFVPLDPRYPRERLQWMVADARIRIIVTKEGLSALLPEDVGQVRLDTERDALRREDATRPDSGVSAENLAYIIYTSGSTGRPKGVLVPHRGGANIAEVQRRAFGAGPGGRVLQFSSSAFDVFVWEVLMALASGAALHVAPDGLLPGAELLHLLREERITHALLAPSALAVLPYEPLPELGVLIAGAEPCGEELVARWAPGRRFFNAYGPTETTICSTFAECRAGEGKPPLGGPIANTDVYVLDSRLQPVPLGVPGELFIGGVGVARGYLHRPELTAERFLPHPFRQGPGARLYRTGDVVRWRPDGRLEFLGRTDDQVKIRGYRVEPGEAEALLAGHPELREAVVVARTERTAGPRLVAYVVARQSPGPALEALRTYLRERLPEYMVPSALVPLESLPRTPTGKVDRGALPSPETVLPGSMAEGQAPRSELEERLVRIWREVLGVERLGVDDDFFMLGGDSILAIQAVSRAAQAGVHVTARQFFLHPTIARLAAVAGAAPSVVAEQGPVTGPVVLTPIQRWFLEQGWTEPHHYNQTLLLEPREPLEAAVLERALQHLYLHHDALRLRFTRPSPGQGWAQEAGAPEGTFVFERVDLSGLGPEARRQALASHAARVQAGLGLEGPLAHAVLYEAGLEVPSRLLLTVHHLAVDVVSWRILLEDLLTAYQQLRSGEQVRLPPKTTSFQQWAERLDGFAQSPALREEAAYWLGLPWTRAARLPVDGPGGANTVSSERKLEVSLEAAETQALLQRGLRVWRARIEEVLPGALAEALRRETGVSCLAVDMEGHGREELVDGVDLSRTVGWFTSLYPVLLETREGGAPGWLPAIKETLRRVPRRGVGYGLLRYLTRDTALAEQLRTLPVAEVSFNYLGPLDATLPEGAPLALVDEPVGPAHSPSAPRSHLLSINAFILEGRLRVSWAYSEALHQRETIERLARGMAEVLRELAAAGASEGAGALAPSDFPLVSLSQASLRALMDRLVPGVAAREGDIEDIYPLAPLQREMLARQLESAGSGAYLVQVSCELEGALDTAAFVGAWREVVARHPILRTAFVWEGLEEPLQVVLRAAPLSLREEDWRGVPGEEREARLSEWLARELRREFEPSRAPLLRLTLLRLGKRTWRFVFGCSHLVMDGWSMPRIVRELFTRYEALCRGGALPSPEAPPFRDFISWLARREGDTAREFWGRMFAGYAWPAAARDGAKGELAPDYREYSRELPERLSANLQEFARGHQLTLGTLLQAGWALVLSQHGGEDVVFGTIVSVRPSALTEVETRVGPYIQLLPVRVRRPGSEPSIAWLHELQARLSELRQHDASSLEEIRRACGLPAGSALFESLVVFENYPLEGVLGSGLQGLELRDVRAHETSGVPLAVMGVPGRGLRLYARYDASRFTGAEVEGMLGELQRVLERLGQTLMG
jgi:natural product biosynthesis luciferase-like monooxygenase protein/amino acid adenylation domain-containing protein/non-ribosomal peptide synthase protein (TIGR01720 family)